MKRNLNSDLVPLPKVSDNGQIEAVFRDVRKRLLEFAKGFDAIVGCMAFLTDQDFIEQLSGKMISLVTLDLPEQQKLFINDVRIEECQKFELNTDVLLIPALYEDGFEGTIGHHPLEYGPGWQFEPLYYFAKDHMGAMLHHKFLVFLRKRLIVLDSDESYEVHPWDQRTIYLDTVAVWTGSYNLTKNASYSLENGVIIHSPKIAREYFREFFQVVRLLDRHEK